MEFNKFKMGKSKKRNLNKGKSTMELSRKKALSIVAKLLEANPRDIEAKDLITLFGLNAEELAEEGVSYETLRSFDGWI